MSDKAALKQSILKAGQEKQLAVVQDFRERIDEMRKSELLPNDEELDDTDKSMNDEANELISKLADQLNFANQELEQINRMDASPPLHEEVDFGSVVVTDRRNFFISVSLEPFDVQGQSFLGLSTSAPIYEVMRGMKTGDLFIFNGTDYNIKEIF